MNLIRMVLVRCSVFLHTVVQEAQISFLRDGLFKNVCVA